MRIAAWHCLRGGPAETTVLGSFWDTAPLGAGLGFRGKSGLGVTARQRQQSGQDGEDSSRSLLHRLQAAAAAEGRAAGRSCRGLPLRRRSPGAPSAPSESGTPAAREDARSHPAPHVVSGGSGLSASLPVTAAPPQGEDRPPLSKASRKGGWGGGEQQPKKPAITPQSATMNTARAAGPGGGGRGEGVPTAGGCPAGTRPGRRASRAAAKGGLPRHRAAWGGEARRGEARAGGRPPPPAAPGDRPSLAGGRRGGSFASPFPPRPRRDPRRSGETRARSRRPARRRPAGRAACRACLFKETLPPN